MKKKTFIIVDNHDVFRCSLREVLNTRSEILVVADCPTAKDACEMAKKFLPDIVMIDVMLPDVQGTEAVKLIKEITPHSKILVLAVSINPLHAQNLLGQGADAFIAKTSSLVIIEKAIAEILNGKKYFAEECRVRWN